MLNVLLGVLAFLFSAVEEWISAKRTQSIIARNAVKTGNWSALFDFVLFFDIIVIVTAGIWLVVPICAGSWIGSWYSVKRGGWK